MVVEILSGPDEVDDDVATTMLNACEAVWAGEPESFTWRVKEEEPGTAGVPVIAPVVAVRLRPVGRTPELRLHTYGGRPPPACGLAE